MLQNLSIQDFILIEDLDLDFEEGFCVITGQTGAGKSILLDAILFAMGSKAGSEVVRTNQEKAIVTLTFCVSSLVVLAEINKYLLEYDIKLEAGDSLIIKRIQYSNGRKKFFVNDNIVTQKIVADLFNYLLEVHGQHNHTLLLNSNRHLEILDQAANNLSLREAVLNLYKLWQEIENEALAIKSEKENILSEIDYLSHICKEFQNLKLKEGEEEELAAIKKQLQTRDREIKLIESILTDIAMSNIEQIIDKAQRNINKSENNEIYSKVNSYLEEIYNKIEETKSDLNNILHDFDLPGY